MHNTQYKIYTIYNVQYIMFFPIFHPVQSQMSYTSSSFDGWCIEAIPRIVHLSNVSTFQTTSKIITTSVGVEDCSCNTCSPWTWKVFPLLIAEEARTSFLMRGSTNPETQDSTYHDCNCGVSNRASSPEYTFGIGTKLGQRETHKIAHPIIFYLSSNDETFISRCLDGKSNTIPRSSSAYHEM